MKKEKRKMETETNQKICADCGKDCLDPPYESGGTPAGSRFLLQTHKFERPENDIALPAC